MRELEEMKDLDKQVAEAQGWVCKANGGPRYWWTEDENYYLHRAEDYIPSTNMEQAGELLEKYQLCLLSNDDGIWHAAEHIFEGAPYGEGKTWMEAVCKAVVALEKNR
jgi:hypothetical protein